MGLSGAVNRCGADEHYEREELSDAPHRRPRHTRRAP